MEPSRKRKILFIMHMPPPVHGAAMMGQYIHDSEKINSAFDCRYVNLTSASTLEDIGRVRLRKILDSARFIKRVKKEVEAFSPDLVYMTPNSKGIAFFKEFLVVRAVKNSGGG